MRLFATLFLLLVGFVQVWTISARPSIRADYKINVLVFVDSNGEGIPQSGVKVTLSGPGTKVNPQTKTTDKEGNVQFSVTAKGRYFVNIDSPSCEPFEGRAIVEDSVTDFIATLMPKQAPKEGSARIEVRATDADSGSPIDGAMVTVQRGDSPLKDSLATDASGKVFFLISPKPEARGGTTYEVKISHPDFLPDSQTVEVDGKKIQDYRVRFGLVRARQLRTFVVTALEKGTRAPIAFARVIVDGGGGQFHTQDTGSDGKALFRLPADRKYSVKISTSLFETATDEVQFGASEQVLRKTYELEKKENAREVRRALIVNVRFKDDDGVLKPVRGAMVNGPGLHSPATDEKGQIVFLHTVPPGETITVTATSELFKPGSAQVLVRDKGVMVDVGQFSRDTAGGMSEIAALAKQRVTGFDTVTITLEANKIESVKKVSGQIVTDGEVDAGEPLSYSTNLKYEDGEGDTLTVEEVIQVLDSSGRIVDRKGGIRTLNKGELSTDSFTFSSEKEGTYTIRSVVSWEKGVVWKGEKTIKVSADRSELKITGDVVAKKGRVKLDERIDVMVNVLYASGPKPTLSLKETVELFDPKGNVVQNNLGSRQLNRGSYSERNFAITCQAPGTYRLKSTIYGEDGQVVWTGQATFEVDKSGKPVMQKPGAGYWKLVKKEVGNVPGPATGQYGTMSGSISESSFSLKYESVPPWDAHLSIQVQYSVPPTVIKVDETIELTVTASASISGKDLGSIGIGAGWYAIGSGEVVELQKVFVGKASDGKEYTSANGKTKIKVGSGGKLKIGNYQAGQTWGSSTNWNPCTYEYEWVQNAAPPEPEGPAKATLNAEAATEKSSDPTGSYSVQFDIPRNEIISHWARMQITKGTGGKSFGFSGQVTSRVQKKGYNFTFSGNYSIGSNKFRGQGTVTYPSNMQMTVQVDGSMRNGKPSLTFTILDSKGKVIRIVSATLSKT